MIHVGIMGGETPEAGELLRLLVFHPDVELVFVHSAEYAGLPVTEVHHGLYGDTELRFTHYLPLEEADLLFVCAVKGGLREFLSTHELPRELKVIDFGAEFRLPEAISEFEYGLPELNRRATCHSRFVANPGALPTCVLLGLLPLAKHLLLPDRIEVRLNDGLQTEERKNLSTAELSEICAGLVRLQTSFSATLQNEILPHSHSRVVSAMLSLPVRVDIEELKKMYEEYYAEDAFTWLMPSLPTEADVLNTNKCVVHLEKEGDLLTVRVYMDRWLKGASGQALHNMNLLFNLEESVGLKLKASIV
ncbi:MAG: N-acetyl-gamma-glutamyl-phosphate reductase [Phocaeicola sp.]|nr:N-acetyl-gamma-glutamyl-phosphate reductase [Phocaeicola sp.]MDY5939890.1 N-acetyl-gamma-glutamyl-phosphate reductase [Phocaeicola sp.]